MSVEDFDKYTWKFVAGSNYQDMTKICVEIGIKTDRKTNSVLAITFITCLSEDNFYDLNIESIFWT
jgi:hypothetical protein